jgi:hypothetical protein
LFKPSKQWEPPDARKGEGVRSYKKIKAIKNILLLLTKKLFYGIFLENINAGSKKQYQKKK